MNPRFNLTKNIELCGQSLNATSFFNCMKGEVTPERLVKIEEVSKLKTFDVAIITENIFDRGNLNAIMRSCENFGFSKLYSYEAQKFKKANPNSQRTTTGADKWLEYKPMLNYEDDIQAIKEQGYKIVSTSLAPGAKPLAQLDLTAQPVALVFGNEKTGITPQMQAVSDELCIIENAGFTQSLNVSVAAAIVMHEVFRQRRKKGMQSGLSPDEQDLLKAHYLFRAFQKFEYRWEDLLSLYYQRRQEQES